VKRAVYPTVPPRVEYALTPLGKKLLKTVEDMSRWAMVNRKDIERARAEFDRHERDAAAALKRRA
jgi:DNA-binding HxlR family transcriptional regulator